MRRNGSGWRKLALWLALGLTASGCAGLSLGKAPPIVAWEPQAPPTFDVTAAMEPDGTSSGTSVFSLPEEQGEIQYEVIFTPPAWEKFGRWLAEERARAAGNYCALMHINGVRDEKCPQP